MATKTKVKPKSKAKTKKSKAKKSTAPVAKVGRATRGAAAPLAEKPTFNQPIVLPDPVAKREPKKREFPRGTSPYSSPQAGDLLKNEADDYRLVHGVDDAGVKYLGVPSGGDGTHVYGGVINKGSWAGWCCRSKAKLVQRGATVDTLTSLLPAPQPAAGSATDTAAAANYTEEERMGD